MFFLVAYVPIFFGPTFIFVGNIVWVVFEIATPLVCPEFYECMLNSRQKSQLMTVLSLIYSGYAYCRAIGKWRESMWPSIAVYLGLGAILAISVTLLVLEKLLSLLKGLQ
jgi:hypothetical protein